MGLHSNCLLPNVFFNLHCLLDLREKQLQKGNMKKFGKTICWYCIHKKHIKSKIQTNWCFDNILKEKNYVHPSTRAIDFILFPIVMLVTQSEPQWLRKHAKSYGANIIITFWWLNLPKRLLTLTARSSVLPFEQAKPIFQMVLKISIELFTGLLLAQ